MTWAFYVGGNSASQGDMELVVGVSSRSFTRKLVGSDEIGFTLKASALAASLVTEHVSDTWAYRDGVLVGRGRVLAADDSGDENDGSVTFKAFGYEQLLESRFTDSGDSLQFVQVEQADLAWALINLTQSRTGGGLGITKGTNGFTAGVGNTGVLRDRTYQPDQSIGKLLRQLAEVSNGFDFEIDAQKRLQVYYPQRGAATATAALVYGSNVASYRRSYSWGAFGNAGAVTGAAGTARASAVSGTVATDPRGRVEWRAGYPTVTEAATLTARAATLLTERQRPVYTWSVTLKQGAWLGFGSINVGDAVKLVVRRPPRLNVNGTARVHEINVRVGESGEETVTMKLEQLT